MNIADIIVIAVIGLFTIIGIKNGLIRTIIKFGSLFLSLFIAFVAYPMFSGVLLESEMAAEISDKVSTEYVMPYMSELIESNVPRNTSTAGGVLSLFSDELNAQAQSSAKLMSDKITALFINVIVFLIILIVCRIAFVFVSKLLIGFADFPVIRQLDIFAGGILGFVQGLLICLVATCVIAISAPVNEDIKAFDEKVQNSKFASQIYNNNFILNSLSDKLESMNNITHQQ